MSGTSCAGGRLLARPGVLRTFVLGLVGRLGYGVLPLSFLFAVREATGSFPAATGAVAVVGLGTLAMPLQARARDRRGQRRVLPLLTRSWVLALLVAVTLSLAAVSSPAAWLLAAAPLGPARAGPRALDARAVAVIDLRRRVAWRIRSAGVARGPGGCSSAAPRCWRLRRSCRSGWLPRSSRSVGSPGREVRGGIPGRGPAGSRGAADRGVHAGEDRDQPGVRARYGAHRCGRRGRGLAVPPGGGGGRRCRPARGVAGAGPLASPA